MKTYAKLTDGVLVTTCVDAGESELVAQIKADGFRPYDDSAPKPNVGEFQATRAAYREEPDAIYLSWEIVDNSPEKVEAEITRLQSELSATDYKIIKAYEYTLAGEPPPYNIETLHEERQDLRDKIKELESLLNS